MPSRVIQEADSAAGKVSAQDATERSATERSAKESPAGTKKSPAGATVPTDQQPARRPRPAPLKSVPAGPVGPARFPGTAPVTSTELWIGMHLIETTDRAVSNRALSVGIPSGEGTAGATAAWGDRAASEGIPSGGTPVILEKLALCAQRFTPRVSLVPPDGLLLEVKGSLHLFGGVEGLSRALASECASLGLKSMMALAPTPLAALVAARAGKPGKNMGKPFVVTESTRLVGQLMPLPLAALRWPEETLIRLARMGVRTIGQALRLPRAGFARRFGTDSLATLDRLTGRSPDLRDRFHARERFRRRRELNYELESHDAILAALEPLLAELGKFLEARQCGVMKLECLLRHRHAEPTSCVLGLAAPLADVRRLTELLGERLSRLTLPEPVRACELRSSSLVLRVFASNSVWQPGEHGGGAGAEAPELIERLRVRLGPEAVYGLQVLPGHRPENAWGVREPVTKSEVRGHNRARRVPETTPWPAFRRPTWLLPMPKLLSERDGLPRRRGPLRLLSEPERIETGWWDGGDIARDYYTALDVHGVRLWIFRERAEPHRWFLHGVFG